MENRGHEQPGQAVRMDGFVEPSTTLPGTGEKANATHRAKDSPTAGLDRFPVSSERAVKREPNRLRIVPEGRDESSSDEVQGGPGAKTRRRFGQRGGLSAQAFHKDRLAKRLERRKMAKEKARADVR